MAAVVMRCSMPNDNVLMVDLAPINECGFPELLGCVGRNHLAGQRLCIWV